MISKKWILIGFLVVSCTYGQQKAGDVRSDDDISKQENPQGFKTFPGLVSRDGKYYKGSTDKLFTGSTKSSYDNGTPFVKAFFKEGELHGTYTAFYMNGQKMGMTNYKNGIKDGEAIAWHENGQKASKVNFEKGKEDGRLVVFYPNGQPRLEAHYKKGELDGSLTQWLPDGKIHSIKSYEADSLMWEEFYNQDSLKQRDSI